MLVRSNIYLLDLSLEGKHEQIIVFRFQWYWLLTRYANRRTRGFRRFFCRRAPTPVIGQGPQPIHVVGTPRTGTGGIWACLWNLQAGLPPYIPSPGGRTVLAWTIWASGICDFEQQCDRWRAQYAPTPLSFQHPPRQDSGCWWRSIFSSRSVWCHLFMISPAESNDCCISLSQNNLMHILVCMRKQQKRFRKSFQDSSFIAWLLCMIPKRMGNPVMPSCESLTIKFSAVRNVFADVKQ